MNRLIIVLLSVFALASCAKIESNNKKTEPNQQVELKFKSSGIVVAPSGTTTRVSTQLAEGTTVRILVYSRVGANADPASDVFVGENTYMLDNSGMLVAVAVDDAGVVQPALLGQQLFVAAGDYDFYAVTPAIKVTRNMGAFVKVDHQMDYATSLTENETVSAGTYAAMVILDELDRKCSLLEFAMSPLGNNVEAIEIVDVVLTNQSVGPLPSVPIVNNLPPISVGYTMTLGSTNFTNESASVVRGSTVVLPKVAGVFYLTMRAKLNGESEVKTMGPIEVKYADGTGIEFLPGHKYQFTLRLTGEGSILTVVAAPWGSNSWSSPVGEPIFTHSGSWESAVDPDWVDA